MLKNICYVLFTWGMLLTPMVPVATAAELPESPDQPSSMSSDAVSDPESFSNRVIASYRLLQDVVTLLKSLAMELESKGQSGISVKPLEKLQENLIMRLILAKYLTRQEMETMSDFLNTPEVFYILLKMIQHLLLSPEHSNRQDMENLVYEIKAIYFVSVTKRWLGETTNEVAPTPPAGGIQTQSFSSDKVEVRDKLIAARQLVEACLPLVEGSIIRMLNQRIRKEVKDQDAEIEGAWISLSVRAMVENLREDPVLILTLAKHFRAEELTVVVNFLSKEEILLGVDRISRLWFSLRGEQLQRDLELIRQEFHRVIEEMFKEANKPETQGTEKPTEKGQTPAGKTAVEKPVAGKKETPGVENSRKK